LFLSLSSLIMEEPTVIFTSYENEFAQLIDGVKQYLEQDGSGSNGAEAKKAALRRVELSLDEADDLLSQMQIEIQGIPTSIRMTYTPRLKRVQAELAKYKKLSREAHASSRNSTTGGGWLRGLGGRGKADPSDSAERGERDRLLVGTEMLDDGTRRLQTSTRLALETEDQGAQILATLQRQREQIQGASDTLHTADHSIDRASGTLKKMIRQMYKQRVVISVMIVVLIIVVLVILWAKLWRR